MSSLSGRTKRSRYFDFEARSVELPWSTASEVGAGRLEMGAVLISDPCHQNVRAFGRLEGRFYFAGFFAAHSKRTVCPHDVSLRQTSPTIFATPHTCGGLLCEKRDVQNHVAVDWLVRGAAYSCKVYQPQQAVVVFERLADMCACRLYM